MDLPRGAVTFLFTDVEGSTQLVKVLRNRYAEVLAMHHRLLRAAFEEYRGHEIDTQGDAFFVAFANVKDAVLAAVAAQRALTGHRWPDDVQIKIRIGIHTGQAAPADGRYTGLAVHRAARICAAGHGGQVLISQATQTLLEDEEEDLGFGLLDLGDQLLKDFDRPVRLYQVDASGLEQVFPVVRTKPATAREGAVARVLPAGIGPFVGRQREIATLKTALEDAISTRGRLVMLVGEPGIGKTRTAGELAHNAVLQGAEVLWGRCYESEGAPPYWPWVQAIRTYVRSHDPGQITAAMGDGAADIAEIVDDLRGKLPGLGPRAGSGQDPKQARFRLFDAIASFLRAAAARQPIMLVLEDLHAADGDSLLLLEFVAQELAGARLLLVGTYRDVEVTRRHPLGKTLAELARGQLAERVLLPGLSQDEVARVMEAPDGGAPSGDLIETVYAQTDGNPFFVTEIVRLLAQEEGVTPDRLEVRIPEGVREVVGQRLDRLSELCNDLLTIAAVIGRGFQFHQLRPLLADTSEEQLVNAVEEALGARLIEELPGAIGLYQFAHGLIRETLVGELSTTRRVRLHARIAKALEELYGADAKAHASELAHHFTEAESLLGPEKVVRYSQLVGEQAVAGHAYEEAIAHFERALEVKDGQPMDHETATLLFGLARAELGARELYELGGALARMTRAFDFFLDAGNDADAVAVAVHPIPPVWETTDIPRIVDRALTMVPEGSLDSGRLLATRGWFEAVHQRNYASAQDAFARALDIARGAGDVGLETRTLVNAAHADYWHMSWDSCREKGMRAIDLAIGEGDSRSEMAAREWPARVGAIVGDLDDAKVHAEAAVDLAQKLRERHELANSCMYSGWLYALSGDWQTAREFSDRALALEPREPRNLSTRALLEVQVGEFEEGERYLEQLMDPNRVTNWSLLEKFAMAAFIPMAARVTGNEDRLTLAREAAESALSVARMPPFMHLYGRIGLAFIAVQLSDPVLSAQQYDAFESQQGTAIMMAGIAVDRLLGLLALVQGRADEAVAHFENALTFCQRAAYRPEYAWAASEYAEAILGQVVPGDRKRAHRLQDEGLTVALSLQMRPLTDHILARRGISATPGR